MAPLPIACRKCHHHDGVCCNCHTRGGPPLLQDAAPTTQKAKGIQALAAMQKKVPRARLLQSDAHMHALLEETLSPLFARPCPPTPRPGFVDSRICKTGKQIQAVWEEARKADPKAELLLMPPLQATHNIVMTPGLMTIGLGHDGATAGKDAIGIGLCGEDPELAAAHAALAIAPGEVPHAEFVQTSGEMWWTQCRSGPAHPGGGPDFLPQDITVQAVVEPCEDFLEWEGLVQAGFAPGTVVWGKGHTLGSHAALHCLAHGIPFVTSQEPHIGDALQASPALPAYDLAALRRGLQTAWAADLAAGYPHSQQNIHTILYGLHNASALRGADSWWVGLAAMLLLKYGTQAVDVELHINHACLSKAGGSACMKENKSQFSWLKSTYTAQEMVDQIALARRTFHLDFSMGGIGGHRWAWCAHSLQPLAVAIQAILGAGPVADAEALAQTLIVALNEAVNQAHNGGGFWMNKYGGQMQAFGLACQGDWQFWAEQAQTLWVWNSKRMPWIADTSLDSWLHATIDQAPGLQVESATVEYGNIQVKFAGRLELHGIPLHPTDTKIGNQPLAILTALSPKRITWHFLANSVEVGQLHIDLIRPLNDTAMTSIHAATQAAGKGA